MKMIFIQILLFSVFLNAGEKTILWLPSSNRWVNEFLSRIGGKNFKLDIALSSRDGLDMEKIKIYQSQKKLEIINIPEGAPFISLLYYPGNSSINGLNKIANNPYFFALRISEATSKFKKDFGTTSGIVLPYGDINGEYIQLARAYGYSWMPSGLVKENPNLQLIDIDSFTVVPFKVLKTSANIEDFNFYLIDDILTSSSNIDMLIDIFSSKDQNFVLTSQLISISTQTKVSFRDFNFSFEPWKSYNEYLLKDEQYALASTLSKMRNDIMSYLNFKPQKTDEILARYCDAEKYFGLYPYLENLDEAENELIKNFEEIYQIMGKPIPDFVYQPLKTVSDEEKKYRLTVINQSITYYLTNTPETPQIVISTFSVSAKDNFLEFEIDFTQSFDKNIILEIYIDINSRRGSGSTKLLDKKSEKIIHDHAWEYALSINNGKASLYQSAYNKILKRGEFDINLGEKNLNFKIPVSSLKGNHLNWTYIPLLYLKMSDGTQKNIGGIFSKTEYGYIYPIGRE